MTAVLQPQTPGFSALPYTDIELTKIERIPHAWLTSMGRSTPTTVDAVLFHLKQSSIVYFACHEIQYATDPLHSGLVLSDGRLKVSEIMRRLNDESSQQKKQMSLAFLSACETAKGDDELPDEAMHLAAALLFAGFRSVIATMW
jgi:CHAT domain-containing protein